MNGGENISKVNCDKVYETDKQNFDNFVSSDKSKKSFDYQGFKRLIQSELVYKKCFDENNFKICGYTRKTIQRMAEHPEKYGKKILDLSDFIYLKSGYYKRLIDYFVNQSMVNYTVDTKVLKPQMLSNNQKNLKDDYIKFSAQCEKYNLSNEIQNIMRRLYKNDVCYAFVTETSYDISYYYLDPKICGISSLVNGNVYEFYINAGLMSKRDFDSFPIELQEIIHNELKRQDEIRKQSKDKPDIKLHQLGKVVIPWTNSLCVKYNNDTLFPYPPFFMMILDILLIDEYKELAKAQSINDAYKILTMKIPTVDGEVKMDDPIIATFTSIVLDTIQNNIGVVTSPFDMKTEEFSSSNSDDRDTVSDAISWAFKNVGVSEALMSGASSGSELKLSITNDSGDIFRLYRMIENWVCLQMKLRGYIYPNYDFVYKILNMTIFNADDVKSMELQMAQNGLPNKARLCAANGLSPAVMFGNSIVENNIFGDIFDSWQPMKTSYTASADDSDSAGRPTVDDGDLSSSGEVSRNNDSNNKDNRI